MRRLVATHHVQTSKIALRKEFKDNSVGMHGGEMEQCLTLLRLSP